MTRKALVWIGPDGNWLGVLTPDFPSSENPALTVGERGNSLQLPRKGSLAHRQVSLFLGLWLLAIALLVCQLSAIFLLNWV